MLRIRACFVSLYFAGLVFLARSLNPIPSRTRPLNSSAPMVLWLKPWESRSLPGLPRTRFPLIDSLIEQNAVSPGGGVFLSEGGCSGACGPPWPPWFSCAQYRIFLDEIEPPAERDLAQ